MTKQIKFRGFRVDGKGLVEGYYVCRPDGKHLIYWKPFPESTNNTYHEIRPESLGQFTGQTDKNGKEIFGAIGEKGGDIVRIDKSGMFIFAESKTLVVSYVSQSARFHLIGTTYDNLHEALHDISGKNCSEIIGNQFEQDNGK